MSKTVKITLVYIAVFVSALMIVALVITSTVKGATAETTDVLTENHCRDSFWLKATDGHIAVYQNAADDTPMIETAIDVDMLRAVDKTQLQNGIEAETYEDVLKLLEDFGS